MLHLIATLWFATIIFGASLILISMIKQDMDRIKAALTFQPIRKRR